MAAEAAAEVEVEVGKFLVEELEELEEPKGAMVEKAEVQHRWDLAVPR